MIKYLELYATTKSRCCDAAQQIIQSRDGGFVSKNCVSCGKPSRVGLQQLPQLVCPTCRQPMTVGKDKSANYIYRCPSCPFEVRLYQIVPSYIEAGFRYNGLAVPGED